MDPASRGSDAHPAYCGSTVYTQLRPCRGRRSAGSWAGQRTHDRQPRSGIVVDLELVERQAAGIEQVEDRLLDDLGEMQQQRAVLLDARLAGLDGLVLLPGNLELLGQLVDGLLAQLAVLADQPPGLALMGVGGPAAVGEQARGGGLELDRDERQQRAPLLGWRGAGLELAIAVLGDAQLGGGLLDRQLLALAFLLQHVSEFHRAPSLSWIEPLSNGPSGPAAARRLQCPRRRHPGQTYFRLSAESSLS